MGETNPSYSVFEVALSLEDCTPHTNGTKERKLAGDIIGLRRPGTMIGSAEMHTFLWLRIEGLEENEMVQLTENVAGFDKRRYSIPLDRLKALVPSFDIDRALDPSEMYQPFLLPSVETPYEYVVETRAFNVHGLVFDKQTAEFI